MKTTTSITSPTFAADLSAWAQSMYSAVCQAGYPNQHWVAYAVGYPDGHVYLEDDVTYGDNVSMDVYQERACHVLAVCKMSYDPRDAESTLTAAKILREDDLYPGDARDDGATYLPADEYDNLLEALLLNAIEDDAVALYSESSGAISDAVSSYEQWLETHGEEVTQ